MSGGSLSYLCYKDPAELFDHVGELQAVETHLLAHGAKDIAKDVRRLIEYVLSAEIRIGVLSEQLKDVFHAVEWHISADIGDSSLVEALEEYRRAMYGTIGNIHDNPELLGGNSP